MENKNKKCSFEEHKDINAIFYCQECKIYLCNKCDNYHKNLFKNHNELCCGLCISKLEDKGYGQHKDCDICSIENIKEEKKNKLNENIQQLKELTDNLNINMDELKIMSEKINKNKEELKSYVQNIFNKLRNALNERENELLLTIDNKFNDNFCKENIIEEIVKLPIKIKKSLEKGEITENDWKDVNKLSKLLNYCINIEMDIKNINDLKDSVSKCQKFNDYEIKFAPENESIDKLIQSIKSFGDITILQLIKDEEPPGEEGDEPSEGDEDNFRDELEL